MNVAHHRATQMDRLFHATKIAFRQRDSGAVYCDFSGLRRISASVIDPMEVAREKQPLPRSRSLD
jgi:hypothetical protein